MNGEPCIIPIGGEPPRLRPAGGPEGPRPPHRGVRGGGRSNGMPGRRAAVHRRFGLLNAFLDAGLPTLTRTELAAWLLVYRHAKADGTATASVADLARRAGCGERVMRRALKRLYSLRLLDRLKRGTLAGGPSVWRLLSPDGDRP